MSAEKILSEWKKKVFKPVYWLEGEENFFIDLVVEYAEHRILPASEASFNLTVFYGKDAQWPDIINACRRYPMFAERQVVILKEAQQMRDIDKLESYVEKPLTSTILVVAYKHKKVDGRTKFARILKDKSEFVSTKKLQEKDLPEWTQDLIRSKGYTIGQKALHLLVDHIGNDLIRIDNETEKMLLNLGDRKNISEDDIEKYVGVSKEYNSFELQGALAKKDFSKAMRIVQYFELNPKAAPIQLILPTLYALFSKCYMLFGHEGKDDKSLATVIGVSPFFLKDYKTAAKNYGPDGISHAILLLHHYNLKSLGVNDPGTSDTSLLKELIAKLILN